MPADVQMLRIVEKELELKQNMADKLEAMNKDHKETKMALTENLKTLSNTMSNAFSFLQLALIQRSSSGLPPYSSTTITHFARFASPSIVSFSIHPYSWCWNSNSIYKLQVLTIIFGWLLVASQQNLNFTSFLQHNVIVLFVKIK